MRHLSLLLMLVQLGTAPAAPELQITSPPEFRALQQRLETETRDQLADVARLVGATTSESPLNVELAPETSRWVQTVPPWIAGFALGQQNLIVIFPARSPSYPHSSLEDVLRHEAAHILIYRVAGGRSVPRWFNEGLAMAAERQWRFSDQTQLFYQLMSGTRESLGSIDRLFDGGQQDQTRAYLLSAALLRDFISRYGEDAPSRLLGQVGNGASFETAFFKVTGQTTTRAERDFWDSHRVWTTWIPVLFSDEVLWIAVTLLALAAIQRKRRRSAEIQRQWEEEDGEDA